VYVPDNYLQKRVCKTRSNTFYVLELCVEIVDRHVE